MKPWSQSEIAEVRECYPEMKATEIALRLNRGLSSIYNLASRLGLRKSAAFVASSSSGRWPTGVSRSAATQFKKGNVPHNKGMRRPGYAPGRMAETQFKKGQRNGVAAKNWRPIGTILWSDGYLRIKVREPLPGEPYGFGNCKAWPLLQRHVWERHNGPIPAGHAVVFKDRDPGNCDIDNLELISRRELMARNTIHHLPKELKEVIQLSGVLNRKIRSFHEKQDVGPAQSSL